MGQHLLSFFFLIKGSNYAMKFDINNINDYVKINGILEVNSPFILTSDGNPDPEGIFSQDIFGRMGSRERSIKMGYINLKRKFIHPFVYDAIYQMYRNLPTIISGERWVKLSDTGEILKTSIDDPKAETGIDFFINNWKKIKWDIDGDSKARAKKENIFSTLKEEEIFIDKWLVLPAMYRDINLHDKQSKGKIDMDEVNSLYIRLINYVSSESITFTSSFLTQSNVQSLLSEIHNYLIQKPNGKKGVIHSGVMGKTVDYAAVSVISAPRFIADSVEEQQVPFNHIGVPLYLVCSLFYPFIVKGLEDIFFDVNQSTHIILGDDVVDVDEKVQYTIDSQSLGLMVKAYIKDKTKGIRTARFSLSGSESGRFKLTEEQLGRPFTLTDLLYRVAADVTMNKNVYTTRFPITDAASTVIGSIKIITTEKTVDLSNGAPAGTFDFNYMRTYPYFPVDSKGKIIEDKVFWIDTVVPNNSVLAGQGKHLRPV